MAKRKKDKSQEEDTDNSPDLSVSDSVINRSQINVDKSTTNITNEYYVSSQDTEKKEFTCPACNKIFTKEHSMFQHYRDACGSKSSDDANLEIDDEYDNKIDDDEDVTDSYVVRDFTSVPRGYRNPEEDYDDISLSGMVLSPFLKVALMVINVLDVIPFSRLVFGLFFAVIYVFFSDEIYNLLTAQIYELTYWAGTTLPLFVLFGVIYALGFFSKEKDDWLDDGWDDKIDFDRLLVALAIVSFGPFIVALASIIGNLYGIFWLAISVYILSLFFLYNNEGYFESKMFLEGTVPTIILVAVAQFFIVFEDTFKGVGISYATILDGFFPTVIKYELVYALISIGLGLVLNLPIMFFAETSSEEEHYISHGIVFGLLFFLTEFFVYPISDNIFVAIIFAIALTFISFKGTKMFFDYNYQRY